MLSIWTLNLALLTDFMILSTINSLCITIQYKKKNPAQLITQQIWTFYQSKHQEIKQSQMTDYCVEAHHPIKMLENPDFPVVWEKKSFPVFILGAASAPSLLGNVER